jgi:hypothetical protein
VAKHPFLSDKWIEEAKAIRDEAGDTGAAPGPMKMNMVIVDVPGRTDPIEARLDTTGGTLDLDTGHLPDPEVTITLDYATAKAILVEQNQQAGMQAFMSGKIKVQGDMTKLMTMAQGAGPDPAALAIADKIKGITE